MPLTGFTIDVNGIRKTFNINDADPMLWWSNNFPQLYFTGSVGETIHNMSDENLRVMYRYEPQNQDTALSVEFTDNPTADKSDGWATVCLAPAEQNSISCDGAESAVVVGLFMAESRDPSNAPFSLKIDGVSMGENMTLDDIKLALSNAGISSEIYYQLA